MFRKKQGMIQGEAKQFVNVDVNAIYGVYLIYLHTYNISRSPTVELCCRLCRHFKEKCPQCQTPFLKETAGTRNVTSESSIKQTLRVTVSGRHVSWHNDIGGCVFLWCVNWSCNNTVKDYARVLYHTDMLTTSKRDTHETCHICSNFQTLVTYVRRPC